MIFDISILVIFVLAAVDTLNEISNSQVNRAQELEQELVAASTSSGVSSSSSSDEQSLEQAFIKHKFQEELFNLQYKNKKNDNNTSNTSSNSGSPVTSNATNKKKKQSKLLLFISKEASS